MRRVVCIWLPRWPTDRWRRMNATVAPDSQTPLLVRAHDGRRWSVSAVDDAAAALGLHPGMPLAQAQAMHPGLTVIEADQAGDEAGLRDLALWAQRYAPLTSSDPPDGIRIDSTGADHLHGGEARMLGDMRDRLARHGIAARLAVADTPAAAWGIARYAAPAHLIAAPGQGDAILSPLPVSALRIAASEVAALRRLGLETIGQLMQAPRAPLARRFGQTVLRRLDAARGRQFEPLDPVPPPSLIRQRLTFPEPLLTPESFAAVIDRLARAVTAALDRQGLGARRLDLVFERVDARLEQIAVGLARPARDAGHIARLLCERLERVDPGLGVEAMTLWVPLTEGWQAQQLQSLAGEVRETDLAPLIDRLANRLGTQAISRAVPVESDVPERSLAYQSPLAPVPDLSWPAALPRPVRLISPPEPVQAMSVLPDQPPVAFTWRRVRHRIRQADGPERIFGEWWHRDAEMRAIRDYWAVEDETGRRFWLYRRGDGMERATGDLAWFLHGIF